MSTVINSCHQDLKEAPHEMWLCATRASMTLSEYITMVKIVELAAIGLRIIKMSNLFGFLLKA